MSGTRPAGDDADGLVTCLECGRRFKSLGPHLYRTHHLAAADYRQMHDLPAGTALMATDIRRRLSDARLELMEERPEIVARMRAAMPPLTELAARSTEARGRTDQLPLVQSARRAGRDAQQKLSSAARRARLDAQAAAAGFESFDDLVRQTRHEPARSVASRLGVSRTTLTRWRDRTDHP